MKTVESVTYAVVLYCINPLLTAIFDVWAQRLLFHSSNRLRTALTATVFRKALRVSGAIQSSDSGQMLTLMNADARQASEFIMMSHFAWIAPISVIVGAVFVYIQVEYSLFAGVGVMFLAFPFTIFFSGGLFKAIKLFMQGNDERTKLTNEAIQGIRVVKYGALEDSFAKKIGASRGRQCKHLYWSMFYRSMILMVMRLMPILVNVAIFLVFAAVFPVVSADVIFTAISFLGVMTSTMTFLPLVFSGFAQIGASMGRIKTFLLMDELDPGMVKRTQPDGAPLPAEELIAVRNGTFRWPVVPKLPPDATAVQFMKKALAAAKTEHKKACKQAKKLGQPEPAMPPTVMGLEAMLAPPKLIDSLGLNQPPTLSELNFSIPRGSLTMIIGNVGSGKSSVLAALMGDIGCLSGHVQVGGSVAYCAQQAWISNATVRDNILFATEFDEARYQEAIRVCALEDDIQLLSAGDQTEIGEKGVNLSGGQKQRISLARATYSRREIYLMDDPLSAVDAHVGKHIFEQCLNGVLAGTTRVLVTNALQYLEHADQIIVLNEGKIAHIGHYSELRAQGLDFSQFVVRRQDMEAAADATATKEPLALASDGEKSDRRGSNASQSSNLARRDSVSASQSPERRGSFSLFQGVEAASASTPRSPLRRSESSSSSPAAAAVATTVATTTGDVEMQPMGSQSPGEAVTPQETERKTTEQERAKHLIEEEEHQTGGIGLRTYTRYLHTYGGIISWAIILLIFIVQEGGTTMANWWLSQWTGNTFPLTTNQYMLIYAGIAVFLLLINVFHVVLWNTFAVRSAKKLHGNLLGSVLGAPPSFFESTPTGRILNRFSGDLNQVDMAMPMMYETFIEMWFRLIANLIIIATTNALVLVFFVPIIIVFLILQSVYSRTSRELQRIEGIARSPVFAQFTEVLTGISTIRAYDMTDHWKARHVKSCNTFASAWVMYRLGQKWMSLYQSLISCMFLVATLLVVLYGNVGMSLAGLALTSAMQINMLLTHVVQLNVELESRMTSAERVFHYSMDIPQERTKGLPAPPQWPDQGEIKFEGVQMRYHPELPLILKGVDFHIRPHEKIGVVGRTAAGKSSLIVALFRLRELDEGGCSGRIMIDGKNITEMRLRDVRHSIAIIPQDPVLFSGSLRYNLDLAGQADDAAIWRALELVELKSFVETLDGQLDAAVAENGLNFSVGQRQLICLARALIEERRIVVMDEATASVDPETDAKIQRTIRQQLRDKTVFVVAHRINTIIDYDRILVMSQGQVAEFDTPARLRANPDSLFNQLLRSLEEVSNDSNAASPGASPKLAPAPVPGAGLEE
eukprot:gnl/Trimastix_PCT/1203.p1 GENE.gnl/Trimastix_PCT/1203~~gnl/Trimastix_PCT/1203.p1  ORF type:complete len:1491 (-),score=418.48 gnl/Trimastix_PCT/1203:150-4097(-)